MTHTDCLAGLIDIALRLGASDIHLREDSAPWFRVQGELFPASAIDDVPAGQRKPLTRNSLHGLVNVLAGDPIAMSTFDERGSCDGAFAWNGRRLRFNAYRTGGVLSLALRIVEDRIRSLAELGLPESLRRIASFRDGLILVAGPTGSGKSTTLATLIDQVNEARPCHILTIEDPVEFLHTNKRALVTQRQVGVDTKAFPQALTDAMRQDPDVILIGELRDQATMRTALLAAETGHLVFASIHASDSVSAIERYTSVFPANEQALVQHLLASTLKVIVSQHLLVADGRAASRRETEAEQGAGKRRVLATEALFANAAVSHLIAANQLNQLNSVLETSRQEGMYTLDQSLADLCRQHWISPELARSLARSPGTVMQKSRSAASGNPNPMRSSGTSDLSRKPSGDGVTR